MTIELSKLWLRENMAVVMEFDWYRVHREGIRFSETVVFYKTFFYLSTNPIQTWLFLVFWDRVGEGAGDRFPSPLLREYWSYDNKT